MLVPRRPESDPLRTVMGFIRSYLKSTFKTPPKSKKVTTAKVTTTVGGVTHRLTWADRNAGWRLRCSCGWIDTKLRWTENNAVGEGNRHALAARRRPSAGQHNL
jgi:hypothetical protein